MELDENRPFFSFPMHCLVRYSYTIITNSSEKKKTKQKFKIQQLCSCHRIGKIYMKMARFTFITPQNCYCQSTNGVNEQNLSNALYCFSMRERARQEYSDHTRYRQRPSYTHTNATHSQPMTTRSLYSSESENSLDYQQFQYDSECGRLQTRFQTIPQQNVLNIFTLPLNFS